MKVALTFTHFSYAGQSIRRDIQVYLNASGQQITWKKHIRPISTVRVDIPIGIFDIENNQTINIEATVTEHDRIFSDSGSGNITIQSSDIGTEIKNSAITIEVSERRFVFWKSKAVFTVGIAVQIIHSDGSHLQKYTSYLREDYNRYDDIFNEVAEYWNNEFSKYGEPPKALLDPNLVKAIAYQESRVGNDSKNNGLVNIMQVGNPGDPSLATLRGELREYWVRDGTLIQLKYPDAKVESVRDSVFWAVRWLYHRAHKNEKNRDGSWGNKWLSWREAVGRYGPGVDEYIENVWKIYTGGTSVRKDTTVKLWSFVSTIWLVFLSLFGGFTSDTDIRKAFAEQFPERKAEYRIDIDVVRYEKDPSVFVAVENDGDDWSESMSVGRIEGWRIRWLPDVPYEVGPANGILRARFLDLKGFAEPVLEVWSKTHRENGGIDLYRVTDNALIPIIHIVAYDNHFEDVFDPEEWQKYGGGWYACSTVFKDKQLQVEYLYDKETSINTAYLRGVRQIFCSRSHDTKAELIYEEDVQDTKQFRQILSAFK